MRDDGRDHHLAWARARARDYLRLGRHQDAVASMLSDLKEHPHWADSRLIGTMATLYLASPTLETAKRIIEGFQ